MVLVLLTQKLSKPFFLITLSAVYFLVLNIILGKDLRKAAKRFQSSVLKKEHEKNIINRYGNFGCMDDASTGIDSQCHCQYA
jgi:hypothetical protein